MTPPAGPELDDVHRSRHRRTVGSEAAIRLHQQHAGRYAGIVQRLSQRLEIGRDDRHDVGVDHRRRSALVLLDLGQHLVGDAERKPRRLGAQDVAQHQFVCRIRERIEQANRHRLHLLGEQRIDRTLGIGLRQRTLDSAGRVDALVDHLAQVALHQRLGLRPGEVIKLWHPQRADLEHVAEALGGDQADAGALLFQDRIRGHRGAMADFVDVATGEALLAKHLGQAIDDGRCIIAGARRDLLGVQRAVRAEQYDVGERAADVDADAIAGHDRHSAAALVVIASCHCTFGTVLQSRSLRMRARAASVAAVSTVHCVVSTTTP